MSLSESYNFEVLNHIKRNARVQPTEDSEVGSSFYMEIVIVKRVVNGLVIELLSVSFRCTFNHKTQH